MNSFDSMIESKAARWAYKLSIIPIAGIVLYALCAIVALYAIPRGRTGFYMLERGFYRVLLMTILSILAVVIIWFWPEKVCVRVDADLLSFERRSFVSDYIRRFEAYRPSRLICRDNMQGEGYQIRNLKGERIKIGQWTYLWEYTAYTNPRANAPSSTPHTYVPYIYEKKTTLAAEGRYSYGKLDGMWTFYWPNKQKAGEVYFVENQETKQTCRFDNGNPAEIRENIDKNGLCKITTFYYDGTVQSLCGSGFFQWVHTLHVLTPYMGKYIVYYNNGQMKEESYYTKGDENGPHTRWFPNGQKEFEGQHVYRKKSGEWKYYFKNGQLKSVVLYDNKGNEIKTTKQKNFSHDEADDEDDE